MKVKVCGLKDLKNLNEVQRIGPDLLGFIFHDTSVRNVNLNVPLADAIRKSRKQTVGVFVNAPVRRMEMLAETLKLDYVQLHGAESKEICHVVQSFTKIIKVFSISDGFDFRRCEEFEFADLFLFDSAGPKPGGNGFKFDWNNLDRYTGNVPFFLSGGLRVSDVHAIRQLNHPKLVGVDINSGFERSPGDKNPRLIQSFIRDIKKCYV